MKNSDKQQAVYGDIMVVEDNLNNLKLLTEMLTKAGYGVRSATDGELALRSIKSKLPDLVIMDIKLPGMDGVEICSRLKSDVKTENIPVIFISVMDKTDLRVKAFKAGGVDYITRPIEAMEVLSRIDTHLKMSRLRKEVIKEKKFTENIINTAQSIILVLDKNAKIITFNAYMEKLSGYKLEEVKGKDWFTTFLPECNSDEARKLFKRSISDIMTVGNVNTIFTKSGDEVLIEWYDKILKDENDSVIGLISIGQDITKRKQAEKEKEILQDQLIQSQKMESIGTLAGGVAHDFNNILTSIIGDTDLMMNNENIVNDDIKDSLMSIKDSSLRAGKLVKQLLMFSRKQPVNMKPLNANNIIRNMYKMFNRLLGENINIKTDLCEEDCHINADKGSMEQVLLNLMVNARDSMPKGGNIFVKTKKIIISKENKFQFGNVTPGKYIEIDIEDNGSGMTGEIKNKIFEPFFTTKGEGKGTGLGLSVVFGIVKAHQAGINVYSEPGRGTIFSIYFPVSNKVVVKEKESEKRSLDSQGKGQRILIIEDEEAIQKIAGRILTIKNYKPTIAGSVKEAIEIYKKAKGDFDLVFSDIMLPDGTGLDALKELNKIKPVKKVLLSSGYLDDKSWWDDINKKEIPFIPKPYDMQRLAEKIAEVFSS